MKTIHRCLLWTVCAALVTQALAFALGNADVERALARHLAAPSAACGFVLFGMSLLCNTALEARWRILGAIAGFTSLLSSWASGSVLSAAFVSAEN